MLTRNQLWKRAIKACSFKGLVPQVKVFYGDGPYNRPHLIVMRLTTDTDTGDLDFIPVVYDLTMFDAYFRNGYTEHQMAGIIYKMVCENLSHDVGEWFRYDGKAIFHPHVNTS